MNRDEYLEVLEKEYKNYLEADNKFSFITNEVFKIHTHNASYDYTLAYIDIEARETVLGLKGFNYWRYKEDTLSYILFLQTSFFKFTEWEDDIRTAYVNYEYNPEVNIGDSVIHFNSQKDLSELVEALKLFLKKMNPEEYRQIVTNFIDKYLFN